MPAFFEKEQHVLIQMEDKDDWTAFYNACEGYITQADFLKVFRYLNGTAKTIVIEKGYVDADYRDTYFNFFSQKFAQYPSKTIRANFFNKKISARMLFKLDRYQEEYIGFIVFRPNRVSTIGRTIIDPAKLPFVKGHICTAEYPVHILGAELTAKGFPYISQDSDVTVCAHAACWMIFRYFSQRYSRYAEKWPYEISQLTRDVSMGRLVPSKGLTAFQVTEMFSNFGFSPEIYSRRQYGEIFEQLLYMYVESGLPVVAAITGRNHAITIIGHLSDFNTPLPQTSVSSDNFLAGFIGNDDNHLPYHAIRKSENTPSSGYWSDIKVEEIDTFIVPLYSKIHLSAEHVIELSNAILKHDNFGIGTCSDLLKNKNIITRSFLTSSKSFKRMRRGESVPFGIGDVYCEMPMPKFVWISEISTPDLFKEFKTVGEIIFDATANPLDRMAFLSIHYPDFLLLNDRDFLTDDPRRFKVANLDTDKIVPYPCYVNNLCEV